MNLAIGSVVLLLLLLPGIGWRFTYLERDGGMRLTEGGVQFELVWVVMVSFVVHLLTWTVSEHCDISDFRIDLLIAACKDGVSALEDQETEIATFLWYCLGATALCSFIGKLMKNVLAERLSYDDLFANAGPWSYILRGRFMTNRSRVDVVTVDVLCEIGDTMVLYRGYLNRGFMNEKGNLERIILDEVTRIKFNPDGHSLQQAEEIDVAGDNLVIYSSSIKNINLNFITFDDESDEDVANAPSPNPLP